MENRLPMSRRDGTSEFRIEKKGARRLSVVHLKRHRPEGRESRSSNTVHQLNSNDAALRASKLTRNGTN
jgi:hypothetical protein